MCIMLLKSYPHPFPFLPVIMEGGGISMETQVFQLIPKVAGPGAELRVGGGGGARTQAA